MHAVANVTAVRPNAGPRARPRAAAGARSATAAPAMKIQMGRTTKASGAARLGRRATRTFATEGEYPAPPIALIVASSASVRARLGAKREGAARDALTLELAVDNVTDEDYETARGFNQRGRSVFLKARYRR